MKKVGFLALAFGLAALAVASLPGTADAQLFKRNNTKVVVNNNGGQPVQVRQVQRGGLFNKQTVTEVNVGGGRQFIRQPVIVQPAPVIIRQNVHSHNVGNIQLIQRQHFRGQLDQLNTYSYVHNTPANIRFVTQNQVYVQPAQLVAPLQVQNYSVQVPAPVVVQEYTQPAPAAATAPPCADGTCNNAAPAAGDPGVQYLTQPAAVTGTTTYTQPARVVQRVVTVQRPVAITNQVYVRTAPVRVRQFVQTNCN